MDTNNIYIAQKESRLRLLMACILVFIIAFSNVSGFSTEMDIEKIEKLTEGENDKDIEEKEKNLEGEEDSYLSSNFDRYISSIDRLQNAQCMVQLSKYHLKIPTPPPDLV